MKDHLIVLATAVMLIASLGTCGGTDNESSLGSTAESPGPAVPTGQLTIAVEQIHTSPELGPFNRGAMTARTFWSLMADYLVLEKSDESGYVPCLAESWQVAPDNMSITFKLRTGVQFHDGWGELTAEDVKFTLDTMLNPALGGEWDTAQKSLGGLVDRIETTGRYELTIYSTKPMAENIIHYMAPSNRVGVGIVSKAYFQEVGIKKGNRHPIFSGPYRLKEYVMGERLVLEAVPNHWRVVPEFKTIEFKEVPELMTRVAMIQTGEADIADVSIEQALDLESKGFHAVEISDAEYIGLGLLGQWLPSVPTYDPNLPWLDKRVREAMNLAIDRKEIASKLFHNRAKPVADIVDMPGDQMREPYPYDPEKARQLLAEAGYPEGFDAKMWIFVWGGRSNPTDLLMTVAGYWEQIGIDLDISSYNVMAKYGDIVHRNTTGVCLPFITDSASQPYYQVSFDSVFYSKADTFPLYESAVTDELIEKYLSANTAEEKESYAVELANYFYDEYAFVPLVAVDKIYVTRDTVANWDPPAISYLALEYATHSNPLGTFRLFAQP